MTNKRKLIRIETPQGHPGFMGPGHTARLVVSGEFSETDPFIVLADDWLDKKDTKPSGGPHPHAGFETVTLMLDGEMGDTEHTLKAGDLQMMTAGSGIVHTETITKIMKMRLLQLWLNFPKKDRQTKPRLQDLPLEYVPAVNENGVQIKLYSSSLSGITSPIKNYVPVVIADISIEAGVKTIQQIPENFNTFLYILNGSVKIGEDEKLLNQDQVGWLNLLSTNEASELKLTVGEKGVRLVLYAGKPTGENIVSHGPFIADSSEDIQRLFQGYRQGKMKHISTIPESQKIKL